MRCWWLPKKIIPSSSFISLFFQPKMIAVTRWFSRRDRPWSPNVGGHLSNLWKCHIITIPKRPLRSRKIARCTVQFFSGYFLLALFNHQRMLWVGFLDGFKRKLLHGLTLWHPLFFVAPSSRKVQLYTWPPTVDGWNPANHLLSIKPIFEKMTFSISTALGFPPSTVVWSIFK